MTLSTGNPKSWRWGERKVRQAPLRVSVAAFTLISVLLFPQITYAAEGTEGGSGASSTASSVDGLDQNPLDGPDSATSLLQDGKDDKADLLDRNFLEAWEGWKAGIAEETGFYFGLDYTAVGLAASSSPGDEDSAASGIARLFGSLELINHGAQNTGSIQFKIEHRHAYTDIAPTALGFEVGYTGTPEPVFNDEGFRTTTLYWKQDFLDDRAVARLGFLDIKEYYDVYALASPWSGFFNLSFSTGSNTMAVLPDGALGAMVGTRFLDNFYAAGGIVDASADPTDMFDGFGTFFGDFDTFKTIEFGVTAGGQKFFLENAHVAFWQMDDSEETGASGGWGVNASISHLFDQSWLGFLRGGWAHEGGGAYEASVSTGFGYMNEPGGNLLGVGVNWGRPNSETFPIDLDDQWTGEVFYRLQVTENLQITPGVQLLLDPALNPDKDFVALFGIRGRVTF